MSESSIDVQKIKKDISKGDLFNKFNILNSDEYDHSDFNKEGFYRLEITDDNIDSVLFLGTSFNDIDPDLLQKSKMGINWSDDLKGNDIINLPVSIKQDMIIVTTFPDLKHWQHNSKLFFVKLNPYI